MSEFADVADATSFLKAPSGLAEYSLGPALDLANECLDLASPTYWMTEVLNAVFGFNPLDEVMKALVGDWEAYSRCGQAWGHVGEAFGALAQNITAGNTTLDRTWDGHAADAAFTYFYGLSSRLSDIGAEFDTLRGGYEDAAQAVYFAAKALKDYLSGLSDKAVIAALELAAGSALSVTGVGAVIGYGLAGLEVAAMLKQWGRATELLGKTQGLVLGAVATVEVASSAITKLTTEFVKVSAYDHPAPTV
ncbi:hypothetical protein GTW43_36120 [Streptomyces sp. SID5785]|uniref:hypothetical protein n=1 Tax=Streptomyces sp. SID5785 TaxID=2690309 RepID=UPI001361806F|nr:hypothetical protein [Streptomyces sp. SID5785]MZD10464.1 hypothetical protein [Streptomyces sp. SID5785]